MLSEQKQDQAHCVSAKTRLSPLDLALFLHSHMPPYSENVSDLLLYMAKDDTINWIYINMTNANQTGHFVNSIGQFIKNNQFLLFYSKTLKMDLALFLR